jgi:hypothetical protein
MRDRVQTFKNDRDRAQLLYARCIGGRRDSGWGSIGQFHVIHIHAETRQGRGTRVWKRLTQLFGGKPLTLLCG